MPSSYFTALKGTTSDLYDGRWEAPLGDVLVEVKRSTNARDVRDGLMGLAYALVHEPPTSQAICLLGKSRLTIRRQKEEISNFRATVRPELVDRIWLAEIDHEQNIQGELPQDSPDLRAFLQDLARKELGTSGARVTRETVKAHLINLWLDGLAPVSQAYLSRATKASAPTVAAAMSELDHQGLLLTTPMGVSLHEPSWEDWRRLAEGHAAKRPEFRFIDPSNLARPPLVMARKLQEMQFSDPNFSVSIGGVIGAMHYDETLDITSPPRLDLCVYDDNLNFLDQLDAGLVLDTTSKAKAVVVVHKVQRTRESDTDAVGRKLASPLDCLADLLGLGLTSEARDFTKVLNRRAMEKRNHEAHYG